MSAADTTAFAELMGDIFCAGSAGDPVYLQVQKFHRAKLAAYLEAGGEEEKFKCRIIKRLMDKIIVPANWLMYRLDPHGSRTLTYMHNALKPYFRDYQIFLEQHDPKAKTTVDAWDLETYLDIMDTAHVITRIDTKKDELWGDLMFKCSCKTCFVKACCRESVIWSMVLNPGLKIPPKYAKLEPGARKRRGRPTEKRVERLKKAAADDDARPFVDRAPPRVCCVSHSGTMHISDQHFCNGRRSFAYVSWTGRMWSLLPPPHAGGGTGDYIWSDPWPRKTCALLVTALLVTAGTCNAFCGTRGRRL
jgi:hypothetical protein